MAAIRAAQAQVAQSARASNASMASSAAAATSANTQQAASIRGKIAALRAENAATRTSIAAEQAKIAAIRASIAARSGEQGAARASLARSRESVAAMRAEQAARTQSIGALQRELGALTANTSAKAANTTATRGATAATAQHAAASSGAAAAMGGLAGVTAGQSMIRWGSQLQWAGRQLTYNFTLPLAVAGGAATKFALDNERAMVRIRKVYGDGQMSASQFENEIAALGRAFEQLSEHFGIHQAEVIDVAGYWAQAGSSGVALAESVRLTLDTMILGELEAVEATRALIAIQAQYGFEVQELSKTIDTFNQIENNTGVTMENLISVFERSAGVARSAGIDIQHLGAMSAALVPAAGSATRAGNGLRTIITRLLSPTTAAADVMALMGINVADAGWQSMTATQRFEHMAGSFNELDAAQRAHVSTVIAGRYQVNRFEVLMRDVANTNGYYARALEASSDAAHNFRRRQDELNEVLDSSPVKLQRMWQIMRNAMAEIIQPLIPAIIHVAQTIAQLADRFSQLNPVLQRWILIGLASVAMLGLIGRYVGATTVFFGMMAKGLSTATKALGFFLPKILMVAALPFRAIFGGFALISQAAMFLWTPAARAAGTGALALTSTLGPALARGISGAATAAFASIGALIRGIVTAITIGGRVALLPALWSVITAMSRRILAGGPILGAAWRGMLAIAFATSWVFRGIQAAISVFFLTTLPAVLGGAFRRLSTFIFGRMVMLQAGMIGIMRSGSILVAMNSIFSSLYGIVASGFVRLGAMFAAGWTGIAVVTSRGVQAVGLAMMNLVALFRRLPIWIGTAMVASSKVVGRGIAGMGTLFLGLGPALMKGLRALPALFTKGGRGLLNAIKKFGPRLIRVFSGPWGLAITAVTAAVSHFWQDIVRIWNDVIAAFQGNASGIAEAFLPVVEFFQNVVRAIADAFNALPEAITSPILAVVRFIKEAALTIYEWFQYLNPFARHSPSLVEQVTAGMAIIQNQYRSVRNAGSVFAAAARDLQSFKRMIDALSGGQWAAPRMDVAVVSPQSLKTFDRLVGYINRLNRLLQEQRTRWAQQEKVVASWQSRVEQSTRTVERQQRALDNLSRRLETLQTAYRAHQESFDNYARSAINGQRAMSDAIFENEIAQKRLRLEMLKAGESVGGIDDISSRLAKLQGEIEYLRGQANDLRSAGAGSDILGPIENQIAAMEAEYRALQKGVSKMPVNELENELEDLQRQGEILDLENALKFDPLTRQIDQLAEGMNELPFDRIIAGINRERAALENLQPRIDAAQAAYDRQQGVVDRLTATHDRLNASYDREQEKLRSIQDDYSNTSDAIREMESALESMTAASVAAIEAAGGVPASAGRGAGAASSRAVRRARAAVGSGAVARAGSAGGGGGGALSPAEQGFMDAMGGDFPDPGGMARIDREGIAGDQSDLIDQFTQSLADETAQLMSDLDLFGPIRDAWNSFTDWWAANVTPAWEGLTGGLKEAWDTLMSGLGFGGVGVEAGSLVDSLQNIWDRIKEIAGNIWSEITDIFAPFVTIWELYGPQIREIWDSVSEAWGPAMDRIGETLGPLWESIVGAFESIWAGLKVAWDVAKPILTVIVGAITGIISIVLSVIGNVIGPIIDFVSTIIAAVVRVVTGIIQIATGIWNVIVGIGEAIVGFFTGIFSGDWSGMIDGFKRIWEGIKGIALGIWNVVAGIVDAVVGFFVFLWDAIVGIVSGIWQGVVDWFTWLWDVLVGNSIIPDMIDSIVEWFQNAWDWIVEKVTGIYNSVVEWFQNLWTSVVETVTGIATSISEWFQNAWDWIVEKVTGIYNSVTEWFQNVWNIIVEKVTNTYNSVTEWFQNIWDIIVEKVTGAFNSVTEWFQGIWDTIVEKVSGAYDSVTEWFQSIWDTIIEKVTGMYDSVTEWFQNMWDTIVEKVTGMYDSVVQWFRDIVNDVTIRIAILYMNMRKKWEEIKVAVVQKAKEIWDGVKKWFQDLWNWLTTLITRLRTEMNRRWQAVKVAIIQKAREIWDGVRKWFQDLWNWLSNLITRLRTEMSNRWNNVKNAIVDRARQIWDGTRNQFNRVRDTLTNIVNSIRDRLTNRFNSIRDRIMNAFYYVRDKIGGVFTSISNRIKSGINTAIRAINKLIRGINKVADVLPGLNWTISPIPLLAQGGQIPSKRVGAGFATNQARAIVGEGNSSYPEFVIPTDPSYRDRATDLYQQLGSMLRTNEPEPHAPHDADVPWGGPREAVRRLIGTGSSLLDQGTEWLANAARGAVSTILRPVKEDIENRISNMTWRLGRELTKGGLNKVWGWATKADGAYRDAESDARAAAGGVSPEMMAAVGSRRLRGALPHTNAAAWHIHDAVGGVRLMQAFNQSMHWTHRAGRAVDFVDSTPKLQKIASYAAANAARLGLTQVIYNWRNFVPGRGWLPLGRSYGNDPGHTWHVHTTHVAGAPKARQFDTGGWMMPDSYGVNHTKRPEAVLTDPQWNSVDRLISATSKLVGGTPTMTRISTMTVSRLIVERADGATETLYPSAHNDNRSYNFYGDLSFPNITTGDEADKFIRNLTDMAGGRG